MSKTILDVYKQYFIPSHLQMHMLRVAALGLYIADHIDPNIPLKKDDIVCALLVHDTGNVLKFNLEFTKSKGVSDDEMLSLERVKKMFQSKYGDDEHSATYAIAKEIGISGEAFHILTNMGSSKVDHLLRTNAEWEPKLASYADARVGPHGMLTLGERWDDVLKRYRGTSHPLGNECEVEKRRTSAFELEKYIQSRCGIDLQSITDITIAPYIEHVKRIEM